MSLIRIAPAGATLRDHHRARQRPAKKQGATAVIYTTSWQRYLDRIRRLVRGG